MRGVVCGLGVASPPYRITQDDLCELTYQISCETPEQRRILKALYRRSGVQSRGSVLLCSPSGGVAERNDFFQQRQGAEDRGPTTSERNERYARSGPPLAATACLAALDDAGIEPEAVTHLVTASCTGFNAPGFDLELIDLLPLRRDVQRTHVGFMGCHGAFNALRVAGAFASGADQATALVCSLEMCTLHHYYGWDPEKVVANSLFADGAGAAVVSNKTPGAGAPFRLLRHASAVIEDSSDAMSWRIGDYGFEMTLDQTLPALIRKQLGSWATRFLAEQNLTVDQIGAWAIHPGGPRILDACRDALGLDESALAISRAVLAEHGNMSSATLFFVLDRLRYATDARPVFALGFGPGLTIEAMLLG